MENNFTDRADQAGQVPLVGARKRRGYVAEIMGVGSGVGGIYL